MAGLWTLITMWPVVIPTGLLGGVWPVHTNVAMTFFAIVLSMAWMYVIVAVVEAAVRDRAKRP